MYNTKLSRKDVTDHYYTFKCGYCDLQYLTKGLDRAGYNSGVYGWNWDCFLICNYIAVTTGYRNTVGKSIPFEIVDKYEKQAKEIWKTLTKTYEEACGELDTLRKEFAGELRNLI